MNIFPRSASKFFFALSLLVLSFLIPVGNHSAFGAGHPKVKSGQIDFAGRSMADPTDLEGEWMFFPKRLIMPGDFARLYSEQPDAIRFVSSGMTFLESDPKSYDNNQSYASYAIILKNLSVTNLALTGANVYTSGRILLFPLKDPSRVLQMEVGITSADEKNAVPAILMEDLLPFRPDEVQDYALIIQISNYHHNWGGFWIPPRIAEFQVLDDMRRENDRLNYWIIGVIFFITVYHFAIYSRRREDLASLYLGIFAFVIGFRIYILGNYGVEVFTNPAWNYEFHLKIVYITMIGGAALFLFFLQSCFPLRLSRKVVRGSLWIVLPAVLFVLFTPASTYTKYLEPLRFLGFVISFSGIPTYYKAVRARDEGALISLVGATVVMLGYTFDILNSYGFRFFPSNCAGIGLAFFMICQSQIVAKRFAIAFQQSEFLSRELQNEVQRQTRDIKSILTHIRQGIFTLNREQHTIDEQHSEFMKQITGEASISGNSLRSLFLDRSNLSADAKALTEESLRASLGENVVCFDVNSGNLAREIEYKDPTGASKVLEFDWSPVVDANQVVEKVLVSVRDVSEFRKLEEHARNQEKEIRTILDLIRIPEDRFLRFVDKTRFFIAENREIISRIHVGKMDDIKRLFINMHTVKGASRTYGLQIISDASHEVEQTYAGVQKGQKIWNQAELLAGLDRVEDAVNVYCSIAATKLGWQFEDKAVRLSRREIERTLELLIRLENLPLENERTALREVENLLIEHCYTNLSGAIDEACRGLDSISRDLGKPRPVIELHNSSLVFKDRGLDLFQNVVTHLLRNSLDHGIELPEFRRMIGKSEIGRIRISSEIADRFIEIHYSDDGAGLNLTKLEALGRERGLVSLEQASDQSIAELIFCAGLSTKDSVSEISGRGVGLDAVKSYLEESGGSVQLILSASQDRQHVPFHFVLNIPKELCFLSGSSAS